MICPSIAFLTQKTSGEKTIGLSDYWPKYNVEIGKATPVRISPKKAKTFIKEQCTAGPKESASAAPFIEMENATTNRFNLR
jgi:hypothetical protein